MSDMLSPPVIILGMHRSGTSIVTRLLNELGMFTGARLDENDEALFFSRLNTWVLDCCGGRWDTPNCIEYLLADERGMKVAEDYLCARFHSPAAIQYWGVALWLRGCARQRVSGWGWKDPSNTITLPLWLGIFPNARLIHVVRNGIDVADSLYVRQKKGYAAAVSRYERHKTLAALRGKAGWFGESPRVIDRRQGLRLWAEYLDYAERFLKPVRGQCLELRYEDFLAQPEAHLERLAEFVGLSVTRVQVQTCCRSVRSGRRFGSVSDPDLLALWEQARADAWMIRYGYDQLPETVT